MHFKGQSEILSKNDFVMDFKVFKITPTCNAMRGQESKVGQEYYNTESVSDALLLFLLLAYSRLVLLSIQELVFGE